MTVTTTDEGLAGLLEISVELVRNAGRRTLRWFEADNLVVDRKADGSPVTEADRDAERFLREELEARFPADAIHGEEEDDRSGTSGRVWVIDPIDGTIAFTHGVPLYSNLLGLEDDDGPLLGVINIPALELTVAAARGGGCTANGVTCRVSTVDDVDRAILTTSGIDGWAPDALQRVHERGIALRTWGDGYGYACVATGRVEAMVDPVANHWDLAPMPVVLSEAGGVFTDLTGRPRADAGSGLASNGVLHDDLLGLFQP